MTRLCQRHSAWLLAGYLLLLNGVAYPQTVEHESHHAHHQAATHSSVLCSWMCAAGQGLEEIQIVLHTCLVLVTIGALPLFLAPIGSIPATSAIRGPPVFSI